MLSHGRRMAPHEEAQAVEARRTRLAFQQELRCYHAYVRGASGCFVGGPSYDSMLVRNPVRDRSPIISPPSCTNGGHRGACSDTQRRKGDRFIILQPDQVQRVEENLEEQQKAVAGQRASCNPSAHVNDLQKMIDRLTDDDLNIAVDYMLELACEQAGQPQFRHGDYLATPTRFAATDPRWRPQCEEFDSLAAPSLSKGKVPHRFRLGPIIDTWAKPIKDSHGLTAWASMASVPSVVDPGTESWVICTHGYKVFLEIVDEDWVHPEVALANSNPGGVVRTTATMDPLECPNSVPDEDYPDDCHSYPAQKGWQPLPFTWSDKGHHKNSCAGAATQILRMRTDAISKKNNGVEIGTFWRLLRPEMAKRWPYTMPTDYEDMFRLLQEGASKPRYELLRSSENLRSKNFRPGPSRPLEIRCCQGQVHHCCPPTERNCYRVLPKHTALVWHITDGSNPPSIFKRGLLHGGIGRFASEKAENFLSMVNSWCAQWDDLGCEEVTYDGSYDVSAFCRVLVLPYRYWPKYAKDLYAVEFHVPTAYNEGADMWQMASLTVTSEFDLSPECIMQTRRIRDNVQTWVKRDLDGNVWIWDPVPRGAHTKEEPWKHREEPGGSEASSSTALPASSARGRGAIHCR